MARNSGIVIMAPPSDNADGRKAMATMLSAIKAKQKVGGWMRGRLWQGGLAGRGHWQPHSAGLAADLRCMRLYFLSVSGLAPPPAACPSSAGGCG